MMNEWILSASLLIAAVLAVRFALRGKISLRLQYALWAVVLVRLLLPVQLFTSGLGAGAIAQNVDIAEPVRQVYASANEDRYERAYDEAYLRVAAEYEASQQHYDPIAVEKQAADLASRSLELDLTRLLYGLWLAGMVVMTAVIVFCNVHLGLRLRRSRWEHPAADSLLPVYVSNVVPTPCIFGLFRPAIYLTPEAARDDQVCAHVLAHELTHYRHWDHIWSMLRSLCLVLHWYNPLVWVAAKVSRADAELACDEGTLKQLGEEARSDYGRTLIGLTCSSPVGGLLVTATTMTGSAGSIRERIKLLMNRPRNTVLTVTALILLVTISVGCSFAGAPAQETTAPTVFTPQETTAPSEPTGHAPDNDMSYEGQELPIPENPGSADQTDQVEDLFAEDTGHWYLASLTTLFSDQYSFDAGAFFGSVQAAGPLTKEEQALITAAYGTDALEKPIFRMTAEEMDTVLMQYLGFSVWDVDLTDFLFCPETDSYLRLCDSSGLSVPQILSSQFLTENLIRLVYSLPGDDQHYVVTLMKGENWKVYSNQVLLEKPLDARELTWDEVTQIRTAFQAHSIDESSGEGIANPLACFVHTMYEDITEMSRSDFLAYYPATGDGTQEEFELLKAKYPEFFGEWTWDTMPIPIHRYDPAALDEILMAYAGIRWADLAPDPMLHDLEETGFCYNYTSDFGLMGFYCTGGWVHDGGAVLFSPGSALYLTERDGQYFIRAHLPAISAE